MSATFQRPLYPKIDSISFSAIPVASYLESFRSPSRLDSGPSGLDSKKISSTTTRILDIIDKMLIKEEKDPQEYFLLSKFRVGCAQNDRDTCQFEPAQLQLLHSPYFELLVATKYKIWRKRLLDNLEFMQDKWKASVKAYVTSTEEAKKFIDACSKWNSLFLDQDKLSNRPNYCPSNEDYKLELKELVSLVPIKYELWRNAQFLAEVDRILDKMVINEELNREELQPYRKWILEKMYGPLRGLSLENFLRNSAHLIRWHELKLEKKIPQDSDQLQSLVTYLEKMKLAEEFDDKLDRVLDLMVEKNLLTRDGANSFGEWVRDWLTEAEEELPDVELIKLLEQKIPKWHDYFFDSYYLPQTLQNLEEKNLILPTTPAVPFADSSDREPLILSASEKIEFIRRWREFFALRQIMAAENEIELENLVLSVIPAFLQFKRIKEPSRPIINGARSVLR